LALAPRNLRFRPALEQLESRLVPSTEPTAYEQLLLEQLNDARANPAAYGASIGLDLSTVAPSQPLAFDTRLIDAARFHSQDMNDHRYFAHTSPNGDGPGERMTAFGYPWESYGESIAAGFPNTAEALKGLIIDTGVPDLGHRRHLLAMDATFQTEGAVGVGIVLNGSGPYGDYFTIDTAQTSDTRPYLTGVVYNDANHNGKYDVGEGLGGVTVAVAGVGSTVTFGSGGYSLQLNPGTYNVTVSGPGLPGAMTQTVSLGSQNVRLNVTPTAVAAAVATAAAAANAAWVSQTYLDLLHRPANPTEVASWAGLLQQGVAPATVQAAFRATPEFASANTAWVKNLYRDLLHREAGAAEVAAWVNGLAAGMSSQVAVASMLGSLEYLLPQWNAWVTQAYQSVLQRTPNSGEVTAWVNALRGGMSHEAMVAAMASSQEFAARLGVNSTANWVAAVYLAVLHRSATAGEISTWSGILRSGTSRTAAALMIAQSPEACTVQGTPWVQSLYLSLLRRNPSGAEISLWVGQLAGGTPPDQVTVTFLTSQEYYQWALQHP
jgi:uncharacterized protein YkwD